MRLAGKKSGKVDQFCVDLKKDTPSPARMKKLPPLHWSAIDYRLRGLILAAGSLALASAPEAFLVLWATDQGLQITWVPLIWAAASAVKALVSGPAGGLSDRFGRLSVLLFGWSFRMLLLLSLAEYWPWCGLCYECHRLGRIRVVFMVTIQEVKNSFNVCTIPVQHGCRRTGPE